MCSVDGTQADVEVLRRHLQLAQEERKSTLARLDLEERTHAADMQTMREMSSQLQALQAVVAKLSTASSSSASAASSSVSASSFDSPIANSAVRAGPVAAGAAASSGAAQPGAASPLVCFRCVGSRVVQLNI